MTILDFIKDSITKKWGNMEGCPDYLDGSTRFCYIFEQPVIDRITEFENRCNIVFPQELKNLYNEINGMRLFLSSFNIYGFQMNRSDMEPYDLNTENHNIHARMKENGCDDPKLHFFGSFGGDYVFAFTESEPTQYILVENGFDEVIKEFESVEDIVRFFIPAIVPHYDEKYICDMQDELFSGIPALENVLCDLSAVGIEY